MIVYVINKHGRALMPCKPSKARRLLKKKKAKIISYQPFTIQLLYGSRGYVQTTHLGIDSGAKYVGIAVTSEDKVLSKGTIELPEGIKDLLVSRRTLRSSRRNRKTRYRKCKFKYKTTRKYNPKKKKYVKVKREFTSDRPKGWLPPSIKSRVDNQISWINRFSRLLPNPNITIELGKFDIQKLMNPDIQGIEYQQGESYGFWAIRYYVFERDNYKCKICKGKSKDSILQTHHIKLHCNITYGNITTPHRKTLKLEKTHYNDAIAVTGITNIKSNSNGVFYIKQFRKKKRSLHEQTARKGRKEHNRTSKRNEKNTKKSNGFFLNDQVVALGRTEFISGFCEGGVYVKDIHGNYITKPEKKYKQLGFGDLQFIKHNNNWQFLPHLHVA